MAVGIYVDIVDEDGSIKVSHTFWGDSEGEARRAMEDHAEHCKYFTDALADDRVIEDVDRHAERPEVEEEDEDEIEEGEEDEEGEDAA